VDNKEHEGALKSLWLERRKRFSAKKYGGLKPPEEGEDEVDYWKRTHTSHFADVSA
jgi:hypothetical protein